MDYKTEAQRIVKWGIERGLIRVSARPNYAPETIKRRYAELAKKQIKEGAK